MSPPTVGAAMGFMISDPLPVENITGINAIIVVIVVMMVIFLVLTRKKED